MQQQIVHEAEVHRQHVRLKIPIGVEVDGTRYTVDDWSMGGFGVAGPMTSRQPGERFPVRLMFPFEDFELTLRIDCQLVYITDDNDRFGCRFLALSQGQLSLFRYVVDSYLSGEIVSGGDILSVVGREEQGGSRVQRDIFSPFIKEQTLGRRLRRYAGLGLLLLAGVGVVAALGLGLQERFLVVSTDDAVVDAPIQRPKAPASGTLQSLVNQQQIVRPGDPIARVEAPGAAAVNVTSPCECVVHDWAVTPGQYVQAGDVVAVLVAVDRPLVVRAELPPARAEGLRVGQVAEISIVGDAEPVRGQVDAIDARVPLGGATPLAGVRRTVTVILRSDTPLDFADLGRIARVRIF